MTTLKSLNDIYQAAIKNWFEWEDKRYNEPKFYEGYKKLANSTTDDFYESISNDTSTFEWIVEQLSDGVDYVIKKHPREVFAIVEHKYGNNTVKKYLSEENVKKEDIEEKNQNFLDALFSLLLDKAVYNGEFWVNDAEWDYAEFLQKKVNKFFGNKSMKGTYVSVPRRRAAPTKKRSPLPSQKKCPVRVNFRKML